MEVLHGTIEPPAEIVEAIKAVNERLEVRWNDRRQRWVIYEQIPGGDLEPVRVLEDTTNENAFVPLDMRAVQALVEGDTWRRPKGFLSIVDEIQWKNEKVREDGRKRMHDAIEAAVDTYLWRLKPKAFMSPTRLAVPDRRIRVA